MLGGELGPAAQHGPRTVGCEGREPGADPGCNRGGHPAVNVPAALGRPSPDGGVRPSSQQATRRNSRGSTWPERLPVVLRTSTLRDTTPFSCHGAVPWTMNSVAPYEPT